MKKLRALQNIFHQAITKQLKMCKWEICVQIIKHLTFTSALDF